MKDIELGFKSTSSRYMAITRGASLIDTFFFINIGVDLD